LTGFVCHDGAGILAIFRRSGALSAKKPAERAGFEILLSDVSLQSSYVCSGRAFGTVSDFELYALTFSQSFKTIGLDCREVYE
ncbi:hypothetical protein, partial [Pseudomonas aeruginosa]|uniref:hypothetical protein n=1 Tax=Pseudomonas aeruginosa TaxID=287 RepID=UPI003D76A2CC